MPEPGSRRTGWLHVRVSPDLERQVVEAADALGVTTSEWARRAVVRALDVDLPVEEQPANVADLLAAIERLLREHLEPMAYSAAQDAGLAADLAGLQVQAAFHQQQRQAGRDDAEAQRQWDQRVAAMRQAVAKRIAIRLQKGARDHDAVD